MQFAPAILTLVFATAAMSETRQHGNIIFDVPQGWSVGAVDDHGTLTLLSDLADDACEYCYVYVATGEKTQARLDTYLFSQVTRFIDDDEMPDRTIISPPETLNAGGRPAVMMGQKVDGNLQILFAIKLFGRIELLGFQGPGGDEAEVTAAMTVFQRDIAPMFEGARFVSDGAAPLMPAPEPGPLAGTYWGMSTYWTMGLDGVMSLKLDHHFLTFWPDGLFYEGTPPDGTQPLDQARLSDTGNAEWGRYSIAGDSVNLIFASGEAKVVKRVADGFRDDDTDLSRVEVLANGERIEGTTSDFFYSGFSPGSGIAGGVARTSGFTYRKDGTFLHDFGATSAATFESGGDITGGYATGSEDKTLGTYEIRDGLIILTAGGKEYHRSLIYRLGSDITIGTLTLEPVQ